MIQGSKQFESGNLLRARSNRKVCLLRGADQRVREKAALVMTLAARPEGLRIFGVGTGTFSALLLRATVSRRQSATPD
jgi:hypothetical protein